MKNLKKIKGAKLLSKKEQQAIKGGSKCGPLYPCPRGLFCDPLTFVCIRD